MAGAGEQGERKIQAKAESERETEQGAVEVSLAGA